MKPILFNTEMVRAILDGRKTVTRRTVSQGKSNPLYHNREKFYKVVDHLNNDYKNWYAGFYNDNDIFYDPTEGRQIDAIYFKAPYKVNNILYVRETWQLAYTLDENDHEIEGTERYIYAASPEDIPNFTHWVDANGEYRDFVPWKPSIHMPKKAARIFLKVTDVRVERLQTMTLNDFLSEGIVLRPEAFNDPDNAYFQAQATFIQLWDSTIKKDQLQYYGWNANPYVWVIEVEVIDKAAALADVGENDAKEK